MGWCDVRVTCDGWHVMCDVRQVTYDAKHSEAGVCHSLKHRQGSVSARLKLPDRVNATGSARGQFRLRQPHGLPQVTKPRAYA